MKENNHIDELFRKAADQQQLDFPMQDKIWSRVEERLETQHLSKSKKTWKQLAVAASGLLILSLGFQLWRSQDPVLPSERKATESLLNSLPEPNEAETTPTEADQLPPPPPVETSTETPAKTNQPSAQGIVTKPRSVAMPVISAERTEAPSATSDISLKKRAVSPATYQEKDEEMAKEKTGELNLGYSRPRPSGQGVNLTGRSGFISDGVQVQEATAKDPLYVINGKAITASSNSVLKLKMERELKDVQMDSLIVLKNPLYIINGTEYTEEELFGPQPTSPYYPLQLQEITTSDVFLQKEGSERFGEKGKNGVIVITTKNGKPLKR